jgi:hypothetical protein
MTRLQKLGLLYVCLLPLFAVAYLAFHFFGVANQYDRFYFPLFIVIAVYGLGSWRIKRKSDKDNNIPGGKLDELEREITLKANNLRFDGVIVYLFLIWMGYDSVTEKFFSEFIYGALLFSSVSKGAGLLYYSRYLNRGRDLKLDRV